MTPLKMLKRPCDGCTACCVGQAVRELGKPYYVQCKHICKEGCGIYPDRPQTCKEFECLWSIGMEGVGRPDRCGYFFDIDEFPPGTHFLQCFLVRDFTPTELNRAIPHIMAIYRKVRVSTVMPDGSQLNGGVRIYLNNSVINVGPSGSRSDGGFEIAPEYANQYHGKPPGTGGRVFATYDNKLYFLDEEESAK